MDCRPGIWQRSAGKWATSTRGPGLLGFQGLGSLFRVSVQRLGIVGFRFQDLGLGVKGSCTEFLSKDSRFKDSLKGSLLGFPFRFL